MKLNLKAPYGVVYGHPTANYEQDGKLFGPGMEEVDRTIQTQVAPEVSQGAKDFLLRVLKENPLTKSVIYKEAENEGQKWAEVKDAALEVGIMVYQQNKIEMWKLPNV